MLAFLGALALLGLLMALLVWEPKTKGPRSLTVYCAAGLKAPVAAILKAYEEEFGIPVEISYAGSGSLLASLEISRRGDLYLPADDSYVELAQAKGLTRESFPLALQTAVLAFPKGNPKNIKSLEDLQRPDMALAQANPEATAVGKLTRQSLEAAGLWESVQPRIRVFKPTVNEVANDIKLGTVDAGFIWDALLGQYPELESAPALALTNAQARLSVCLLTSSRNPAAALRLARYMNAPTKGHQVWKDHGFDAIAGDAWAAKPKLHLLSGAMLRPAIDQTIQAFEELEGVEVIRVYNGCGILVTQIKAGERPDAYFSCDTSFMDEVRDLFHPSEDISRNRLVIVVPKGNPRRIKTLKDLAQPGVQVGIGHETKGAMGALTKRMLVQDGSYEAVSKNVKVESPTGDFLINQLRTGSLDAIIAYYTNASASRDQVEIIPIDMPEAMATQPVAVGLQSNYPNLTARLLDAIKTADSRQSFVTNGFTWLGRE
jgi:molybdenum ABC transporter molybdate-binding protein